MMVSSLARLDLNGAVMADRRRPGRHVEAAPALLPMLRGEIPVHPAGLSAGDPLDAARGIGLGMMLSGGMWWGLIYILRQLCG